jgi:hypothetical protein
LLAIAHRRIDHRPIDVAQIDPRPITHDLRIEGRLAIAKSNSEAELMGEEIAGRRDVGDEQLRFCGDEGGLGGRVLCMIGHR